MVKIEIERVAANAIARALIAIEQSESRTLTDDEIAELCLALSLLVQGAPGQQEINDASRGLRPNQLKDAPVLALAARLNLSPAFIDSRLDPTREPPLRYLTRLADRLRTDRPGSYVIPPE